MKKLDEEYYSKLTCSDFRLLEKYSPAEMNDRGFILTNCIYSTGDVKALLNES